MNSKLVKDVDILNKSIDIPCSKSFVHRYLIIASLLNVDVKLNNISYSDDINATVNCLNILNNNIKCYGQSIHVVKNDSMLNNDAILFADSSASTLRILTSALSFCDVSNIRIDGTNQLRNRNFSDLKQLSSKYIEQFPLKIESIENNKLFIDAKLSSQYLSGALIGMGIFRNDVKIYVKNISSIHYINLTIKVLEDFGIKIYKEEQDDYIIYSVKKVSKFEKRSFDMEADLTHAINFYTMNLVNDIKINNINEHSIQAESKVLKYFSDEIMDEFVVDAKDFPDSVAILCLYFSQRHNKTTIFNTSRLKFKESDRVKSTLSTLKKFNINIEAFDNEIVVYRSDLKILDQNFDSYHDHRVVFLISAALSLLEKGQFVIIKDIECINKSFPTFLSQLEKLGIKNKEV